MKTHIAGPSIDPVLMLLSLHKKQHAEWIACTSAENECDRLSNVAAVTWWALLDAEPQTLSGALAVAAWAAELEAAEVAPNQRNRSSESEENVALLALRKVLAFFDADQVPADPATAAVTLAREAFADWFNSPRLQNGDIDDAFTDAFVSRWHDMLATRPTTLVGLGELAAFVASVMKQDGLVNLGDGAISLQTVSKMLIGDRRADEIHANISKIVKENT